MNSTKMDQRILDGFSNDQIALGELEISRQGFEIFQNARKHQEIQTFISRLVPLRLFRENRQCITINKV